MEENTEKTTEQTEILKETEVAAENEKDGYDEFVIGSGFNVAQEETDTYIQKKPERKGLKTAIWISAIVAVSVFIASVLIVATGEFLGIGFGRSGECVVDIKQGMSTKTIASTLKDAGAINSKLCFRVYSKIKGYDGKYSYGVYTFDAETPYSDLARMLMTEGAKAETVSVTIPEMATVEEMADILSAAGVCKKSTFLEEVATGEFQYDFIEEIPADKLRYRLEGYLFPDTYDFYCYDSEKCAHLAVDRMLSAFNEKVTAEFRKTVKDRGYTLHEAVTMASLVELEAGGSPDAMKNVAAVFYNRLESSDFSTLGSSPTTKKQYNHGDDRYNTYVCAGLPVGPLCAPSYKSLCAAAEPTENFPYFYFVTDKSMEFYFTKTLGEHQSTIAKLKREKNWLYETIE